MVLPHGSTSWCLPDDDGFYLVVLPCGSTLWSYLMVLPRGVYFMVSTSWCLPRGSTSWFYLVVLPHGSTSWFYLVVSTSWFYLVVVRTSTHLDHLGHVALGAGVLGGVLHLHQHHEEEVVPHVVLLLDVLLEGHRLVVELVSLQTCTHYTHMHTHTHTHGDTHTETHTHLLNSPFTPFGNSLSFFRLMFIYVYIRLYTFIYVYICLYTFIYVYIHLYTFIYVYTHLYTFIYARRTAFI